MTIQQMQVFQCDKCKRVEPLDKAEYIELRGDVIHVRPTVGWNNGKRLEKREIIIPPAEMTNKLADENGNVTVTLCLSCIYDIIRGVVSND